MWTVIVLEVGLQTSAHGCCKWLIPCVHARCGYAEKREKMAIMEVGGEGSCVRPMFPGVYGIA